MIIATANSKGGVGKTTLAVHLAGWLHRYDTSVALLDCDAQRIASRWLTKAMPEIPVAATSDAHEIAELLPQMIEDVVAVIVDGPGGLADTTGAILSAADAVLIPTGSSNLDIMGMDWTTTTIHEIQEVRGGPPQAIIVPMQVAKNRETTRHLMAEAAKQRFGIAPSMVAPREIYKKATGTSESSPKLIWQMGRSKEVRTAATEMHELFAGMFPEICEKDPQRIAREMLTKRQRVIAEREAYGEDKAVANA